MQRKQNTLVPLIKLGLCAVLALGFVYQSQAGDAKADGTYTWTTPGRNGGPDRKSTLTLKTDGEKVTGKVSSPGRDGTARDSDIQDGKIKGDEVSFTVVREFNGNKMTLKYNGKVTAEGIKGKVSSERNGENQSRDWDAKRESDKK